MAIVAGTGGMTQAQYDAEVARKKAAGVALTGAVNMNTYKPPTPAPTKPSTTSSVGTGYTPPTAQQNASTGASYSPPASSTGATQPKVNTPSYTANPIAPNLSADQSSYFDKTYGGIGNYVDTQQGRFNEASATGNADLLSKLNADASRVGYAFKPYETPVAMPQQQVAASSYTSPYMQLTPNQINTEASYQINKERSDLQTAADKQTANVKNAASYANGLINDSRVLEDFNKSNSVNPFTEGKQTWDRGLIGRQRTTDDTYRAANMENELNAISSDLYNFDKLAPDKRRALENEMTRIERTYGLEVGSLMGTFNGQRTLAGSAQDYAQSPNNPANVALNIQNQIARLDLESYPEQIKLGIEKLQQEVATGKLNQQEAEHNLKELTDMNSRTNQMKNLELEMARLEAKNLPETQRLELQKLRKQIADIGVTHSKPKTEAEILADKVKIAEYTKKLADLESGATVAPKLNTALANSLKSTYSTKNNITGQETLDTVALRKAIIASLNTDEEIDQMLGYFGLPINQ